MNTINSIKQYYTAIKNLNSSRKAVQKDNKLMHRATDDKNGTDEKIKNLIPEVDQFEIRRNILDKNINIVNEKEKEHPKISKIINKIFGKHLMQKAREQSIQSEFLIPLIRNKIE